MKASIFPFFARSMFVVLGYLIGLIVGVVMGLLGGGGALLLPTLIYLLAVPPTVATAYTLVLIGVTALVGVIPRLANDEVDIRTALLLGIPILLGTLLVRFWLTHLIPDFVTVDGVETETPFVLFNVGSFEVTKRTLVLVTFAVVLLFSFASMIGLIGKDLKPNTNLRKEKPVTYYSILIGAGTFIGVLSAFIGAGGGVMIVPLLVIIMGLPMKTVVGTSLAIMAGKSTLGFAGDIYQIGDKIDWLFLGGFAAVMVGGILLGSHLAKSISGEKLKTGFAWFILAMAIFIFAKELL